MRDSASTVTRNVPKRPPPIFTVVEGNYRPTRQPLSDIAVLIPSTEQTTEHSTGQTTGQTTDEPRHVSVLFTWRDTVLSEKKNKFKLRMPVTTPMVTVLRACARMMHNTDASSLAMMVVRTGRLYTAMSSSKTTVGDVGLSDSSIIRVIRFEEKKYGLNSLIGMRIRIPVLKGAQHKSGKSLYRQRWQNGMIANVGQNILASGVRIKLNHTKVTKMVPLHKLFVHGVQPVRFVHTEHGVRRACQKKLRN